MRIFVSHGSREDDNAALVRGRVWELLPASCAWARYVH